MRLICKKCLVVCVFFLSLFFSEREGREGHETMWHKNKNYTCFRFAFISSTNYPRISHELFINS